MRKAILVPALLMTLSISATAFAGAGLPRLARIDVGQYQAQLSGDSPQLHTGSNMITLAVPGLTHDNKISLKFMGPKGQVVEVPLRELVILTGPDGGHGGGDQAKTDDHGKGDSHGTTDSHGAAGSHGAADSHGATSSTGKTDSHGTTDSHGAAGSSGKTDSHGSTDTHGEAAAEGGHGGDDHDDSAYQLRGKAVLPETGTWTAVLSVDGTSEQFKFDVVQGGPNRIFLGVSGSIMAGALVYGVFERRRQQSKGV